MKRHLLPAALLLALPAHDLSTDYTKTRTLRVESTMEVEMEVTDFSMTLNGEPREGRGGGMTTKTTNQSVHLDTFLAHADGAPTHVKRSFESLAGATEMSFGEDGRTIEMDSPLDGSTLELKVDDDGDLKISAIEGSPDDELLEGHEPTLDLDGLLPEGEVEVGAQWEVEGDAIARALGLKLERVLFRPAPREDDGEGQRGRGRGRGMRGFAPAIGRLLGAAEWESELKVTADDEDVDGVTCAVIEVELEASGELPERERQGGRRRDDDRFRLAADAVEGLVEGTFEVTLEGKLLVAVEGRYPVSLELEGTMTTEEHSESSRGDRTVVRDISREYTIQRNIQIQEEE
ncbi:MAG: hypothetical protein GY711_01905 [bacterium]|nr:hypothetical protein [bacterium]